MASDVTLQERLNEATADLAACATADDVAALLAREGIKGRRDECSMCPIARLVEKRLGPGVGVVVAWFSINVEEGDETAEVPMTTPMEAFIDGFDDGAAWQGLAENTVAASGDTR